MGSVLKTEFLPHYTYEDYVQWDGRWEIIYGVPYAMSPQPSFDHQEISHRIAASLGTALRIQSTFRAVLPVDWEISPDTVVQPDNLVVKGKPAGAKLTEAPVIIFEVLSPSTETKDRNLKYQLYQDAGVKYYIMVDPVNSKAEIHTLGETKYILEKVISKADSDSVFIFLLDDFRLVLDFQEIWL